jgi:hypothetical protein
VPAHATKFGARPIKLSTIVTCHQYGRVQAPRDGLKLREVVSIRRGPMQAVSQHAHACRAAGHALETKIRHDRCIAWFPNSPDLLLARVFCRRVLKDEAL